VPLQGRSLSRSLPKRLSRLTHPEELRLDLFNSNIAQELVQLQSLTPSYQPWKLPMKIH